MDREAWRATVHGIAEKGPVTAPHAFMGETV